jgi:hypothetical protein
MSILDRVRGHRVLLPVAAVAAALAVIGLAVVVGTWAGPRGGGPGAGLPGSTPPVAGAVSTTGGPAGRPGGAAAMRRSEPTAIDIPRIDAHSTLVATGLNADGTLAVPPVSQPKQAAWFSGSPTPGEVGPSVVIGHINGNKQLGIFARLGELGPGDLVTVSRKDGTVARFVISHVDRVSKTAFPTGAVYGNTDGPELRLITCGGSFDPAAHSYRDNIVAYAVLG